MEQVSPQQDAELWESVPPGALAFPKYKTFTICRAMRDVEIHSAQKVVHFGSLQYHQLVEGTSYRGAFF